MSINKMTRLSPKLAETTGSKWICRRGLLLGVGSVIVAPMANARSMHTSLTDRAKWRSFGEDNWAFYDPFERSKPGAVRLPYNNWKLRRNRTQTGKILDLIAFAEAGKKQYEAIHMSARRLPPARPTRLTLGQIYDWIAATPGQHHAIGRYQFIPSTLKALARQSRYSRSVVFTPDVQDSLAALLLDDAGYQKLRANRISMTRFMDNLAKIWAGLPLKNGKSYYQGYAGNRATISRNFYEAQMRAILT